MQAQMQEDTPWYRHRWPWLLISGPLIVAIAGFITVGLAAHHADGLVADDYFKRGKEINADLSRDREAARLGLTAQVVVSQDGFIRVRLTSKQAYGHVNATLAHATQSGRDMNVRLPLLAPDEYGARAPTLSPGKWHVILTGPDQKWRLIGTARISDGAVSLSLSPNLP